MAIEPLRLCQELVTCGGVWGLGRQRYFLLLNPGGDSWDIHGDFMDIYIYNYIIYIYIYICI